MDHLRELCLDLEMSPDLAKGATGASFLPISDELSIQVKELSPGYALFAPIAPCPEVRKETLFILLMKGNLFAQGTMGAAIGLLPQERLLTLSRSMPYDMNYRDFKEAVEDFANVVDYWKGEIKTHVERSEEGIL